MKYRKLDENGDYSFGNNSLDFISDVDATAQAIKTKILLFYGEWWENTAIGIPMFESIVGQYNQENIKMSATILLTQRIEEVEGVISVQNVNITFSGRSMTVAIDVRTIQGETTVEVSL